MEQEQIHLNHDAVATTASSGIIELGRLSRETEAFEFDFSVEYPSFDYYE